MTVNFQNQRRAEWRQMKVNIRQKICKLLVMALVWGSISIQGPGRKEVVAENEQGVIDFIADAELPSIEEETTTEQSTQEPTTKKESETSAPVKKKKIIWNGKVVKNATMKGIDVSHHNGDINWKKVAKSDIDYAIIRCGYGENLKKQDDRLWKKNIAGCEKYKIPYGVYIYSYAKTKEGARSEAEHVLRLVKGLHMSFPIYYDMEDRSQERLSNTRKKAIAEEFLGIISKSGYECGIYANLNWWTNYLPSLKKTVHYKWVAQYAKKCTYKGIYQMWQCTARAKVSGIYGDTDLNFWYDKVRTADYDIYTQPKKVRPKMITIKKVIAGRRCATVQWSHKKTNVGYKVEYSRSKKFKNSLSRYSHGTSAYITGLKAKKYYYFRIKPYKYYNGKRMEQKCEEKNQVDSNNFHCNQKNKVLILRNRTYVLFLF